MLILGFLEVINKVKLKVLPGVMFRRQLRKGLIKIRIFFEKVFSDVGGDFRLDTNEFTFRDFFERRSKDRGKRYNFGKQIDSLLVKSRIIKLRVRVADIKIIDASKSHPEDFELFFERCSKTYWNMGQKKNLESIWDEVIKKHKQMGFCFEVAEWDSRLQWNNIDCSHRMGLLISEARKGNFEKTIDAKVKEFYFYEN